MPYKDKKSRTVYQREYRRKRKGYIRRYLGAKSYRIGPVPEQVLARVQEKCNG